MVNISEKEIRKELIDPILERDWIGGRKNNGR